MKEFLDYSLLHLGAYRVTVLSAMKFIAFIFVIMLMLVMIRKMIYKMTKVEVAKKFAIYSLIKYIVLVLSCVIGFEILGFNISVLLAGSAALLVGVGLGLQNLFSDFVSGIILLVDGSIKVNDIIDVNGLVCEVMEINLRTTTVLTRDDKYIILPNTDLTRNHVVNWTKNQKAARFEVKVGVDYTADVALVMNLMQQSTEGTDNILDEPKPFVRFDDYGESALMFSVYFWSEEVFRVENIKSDIRTKLFKLFAENKVTIPFPQRVVHINPRKILSEMESQDKLEAKPQ